MRAVRDVFVVVFSCASHPADAVFSAQPRRWPGGADAPRRRACRLFFVLVSVSREGRRPAGGPASCGWVGGIALKAVPLTVVLFLLSASRETALGHARDAFAGATGLSNSMSPGGISRLLQSEAIAFPRPLRRHPPANARVCTGAVRCSAVRRPQLVAAARSASPPHHRCASTPTPPRRLDYAVTLDRASGLAVRPRVAGSLPEAADLRPRATATAGCSPTG